MKKLIKRNISGRKVLFLFVLTNIVYLIMLFFTIPQVIHFSGGLKILDMMPTGYDSAYVNKLFDTLGEQGRNVYLYTQLPVDMVYPLLFGVSNCLLLAYFLNKLGKLESSFFYLCFLPLFSGLFDYSENVGIISLLSTYPDHSDALVNLTNIFSVLKSATTTIYFSVLIVCIILLAIKFVMRKRSI